MRVGDIDLVQAETIFIAVADGVLADSLRFSLELEGFETHFCDESSLLPAMMSVPRTQASCLVLDQDVFARVVDGEEAGLFADQGVPVVLMVSHTTKRVLARAAAAGVTEVVEKPLLGGVLFDAIRQAIGGARHPGAGPP
jgi:FixJ family two-component response regulator